MDTKSCNPNLLLIAIGLLSIFSLQTQGEFKFRDIKCRTTDKDFLTFEYCYLKAVNRSFNYMSMKVNLYKVPINNATIRWSLYKRANGYKPFLYNVSVDGCKFMKSQKYSPVAAYFYGFFKDYTNMNHTCPFNHDVQVDKLSNVHMDKQTEILPVPPGRYAMFTSWYTFGILRAEVEIHVEKS